MGSFRHKGLQRFFETRSTADIQLKHAAKLRRYLAVLDSAFNITDIDVPSSDRMLPKMWFLRGQKYH
ncbi:MAG: hypothetical protein COB29_14840 [Sulfitobacter sp.]|nr:MAG: hypothetical protein COB29_14840 [Sulfitobacter sp.]